MGNGLQVTDYILHITYYRPQGVRLSSSSDISWEGNKVRGNE